MSYRIVFIGTSEFAVPSLKALNQNCDYAVKLVISQPDKPRNRGRISSTPVKQAALEMGIPVITPDDVNDDETFEVIANQKPDFIVVVSYGQIIGHRLRESYKDRIINVHGSVLPKLRGAAPVNWAILENYRTTGITIMLIDAGLDTGPILNIAEISIDPDEDALALSTRLAELGGKALIETLDGYITYYNNRTPQDNSRSSYSRLLKKTDGRINWRSNSQVIVNQIRGLQPWPKAHFLYQGEMIKVHKAYTISNYNMGEPGEVLAVDQRGILVKTLDSAILITELQFPNKRKMSVLEYLKGNKFPIGIILE